MAPTNIMVAGSTPGQGVEEWVGTLLWWGGLVAGMAALCVALVWATQEERVALPSGGYRRVGSKAWTTLPLDEKTPAIDGTCWSLVGEDYETFDWVQSRGRKEEGSPHRGPRRTQERGHSENRTSELEPRGINLHRQGTTVPYGNQPG
jgi:hypothetical protein